MNTLKCSCILLQTYCGRLVRCHQHRSVAWNEMILIPAAQWEGRNRLGDSCLFRLDSDSHFLMSFSLVTLSDDCFFISSCLFSVSVSHTMRIFSIFCIKSSRAARVIFSVFENIWLWLFESFLVGGFMVSCDKMIIFWRSGDDGERTVSNPTLMRSAKYLT